MRQSRRNVSTCIRPPRFGYAHSVGFIQIKNHAIYDQTFRDLSLRGAIETTIFHCILPLPRMLRQRTRRGRGPPALSQRDSKLSAAVTTRHRRDEMDPNFLMKASFIFRSFGNE
jgi:hypothetical protein